MDVFDAVVTKLDVRQFSAQQVSSQIRQRILEAARMTGTGLNTQHWRFIMVEGSERLALLAKDSTSGVWVQGANFAILVLTNPKYRFHLIDAGRVLQNMQLVAWSYGIASGIFTGIDRQNLHKDFEIPDELDATLVVGFGYPIKELKGRRKNRLPLNELVYYGRYNNPLPP